MFSPHFAYPVHVFYKIRMTRIHDFVFDLARAGKTVTENREILEAAYPGQRLSLSQDFIKDTSDVQ